MSKKVIILAAGSSNRLRPMTNDKPKCLLRLNGETILDYQLKCLAKFHISQILIVVGYKKNMIIDYIRKSRYNKSIKIIYNNIFKKTDNAYSLSLALKYINKKTDSIIILDGDIIFDIELFKKMISSQYENVLVADNNRKVGIEDCKVLIEHNHVKDIGKKVEGFAIYTSMIKLGGEFLNKFKSECEKREAKTEWYTEPLRKVLKYSQRELHVIFTEKLLAYEIDTFEDLITARKIYVELIKKVNQKRD